MRIQIRLYDHPRDARSFASLNYATFRDSIPASEAMQEADFRQHHEWLLRTFEPQNPAKNTILVADCDGRYAGHCWLGTQSDFFTRRVEPWIYDLSVLPEFRGRGIARQLHNAVESHLRARGHHSLGLQVMQHNDQAAAMYAKFGYSARAVSLRKKL